jgi:hypothetical protein
LAFVDDATPAIRDLDKITQRKRTRQGQSVRAFNPLARKDRELFAALASGGHHIRGFTNQGIWQQLRHVERSPADLVVMMAGDRMDRAFVEADPFIRKAEENYNRSRE